MISKLRIPILHYFILQLFMTLLILPILIAWGIPFSITSLIATPLFSPVFTIFLLLSSCIFFAILVNIPHTYLLYLLDILSTYWLNILSWNYGHIMLPIITLPLGILVLIPCLTLFIFITTFPQKPYICLTGFILLFLTILTGSYYMRPTELTYEIFCHTKQVTLLVRNNKTILIDPGYIGRRKSAQSWVQYTLIPEIIRKTGSLTLEHVIVLAPNQTLFKALIPLCTECQIKHLYIPKLVGTLSPTTYNVYQKLMYIAHQNHIMMHLITSDISQYPVLPEQKIFIHTRAHKTHAYQQCLYPKCLVFEDKKIYN